MSMITLNGKLLNVYRAPVRKNVEEGENEKTRFKFEGKSHCRTVTFAWIP